jgi:outer membrane protein OmpA-like peptidoglycan-associated protein
LKAAKEDLGANVNTAFAEVDPNISADGRSIYFVRKNDTRNIGGAQDRGDIWVSDWVNGQWSQARNLGEPVNSARPDNLTAVTTDNNRIILNRGLGKFFFSKRRARGWSRPKELGLVYPAMSWHIESSLSADGKTILATIRTTSNVHYDKEVHEADIYVSHQDEKGTWSSFVNLGPTINTAGEELSPFMSPDGRTLYFASTGHPGFGSGDIFVSKRIGDGWTNWTSPVNLGPRINTSGFDAYYTVPASGDYAYIVSSAGAIGRTDIVRIKLHAGVKPDPVVLVFGKTINAKTRKPVSAEILLDNLGSGSEVARAISDPQTGDFKIILPRGANYGLHAVAKGFLSVNENLELITINSYEEVEKNLLLVPIEVGESIQLNNVFFEQGKATLRQESVPELDRLTEILKENRTLEIELSGYTDSMGPGDALQQLSEDRVAAVIDYLVAHGINKRRLRGRGYGSENPSARNDTEEHRRMNRRVEFRIVKK